MRKRLTDFAVFSSPSLLTEALVTIDTVSTDSSLATWFRSTLINILKNPLDRGLCMENVEFLANTVKIQFTYLQSVKRYSTFGKSLFQSKLKFFNKKYLMRCTNYLGIIEQKYELCSLNFVILTPRKLYISLF